MKDTWALYKKKQKQKQKTKKKQKTLLVLGVVFYVNDNVECLGHEYLVILVGCQFFTAYWLSAIIWSRFVNETHEYLINSFIDHRRKTQNVMNQCWNLRSDPLTAWTGG